MWYCWFMEICSLILPLSMLMFGYLFNKDCPKHINGTFGHRTRRSMQNMDTWKFAHDYSGKLNWKMGKILLVPSALVLIPFYHSNETVINIVATILVLIQGAVDIALAFLTESALKKTFDDYGTRR